MMKRRTLGLTISAVMLLPGFATSGMLLAPAVARADVLPPEAGGCMKKQASDDCAAEDGASGRCEPIEWSRIAYGPHGPQGSVKGTILVCKPSPSMLGRASPGTWLAGGAGVVAIVGGAMLGFWAWSRGRRRTPGSAPGAGP